MSAKKCFGFQWIGQPFSCCDNCGAPYWEHTYEDTRWRRDGTPRRVISAEDKAACKAKWGAS